MMGRLNRDQGQFLYCFNLEEVVPEDHSVRAIAAVLDLSWVYAVLGRRVNPKAKGKRKELSLGRNVLFHLDNV